MARTKRTTAAEKDSLLLRTLMTPDDESMTQEQIDEDNKLIVQARNRFKDSIAAWDDIRKNAVEDQKFYSGIQSDKAYPHTQRARGGQPTIQINQLPNFVQQVENQIRQQNISITVHATDEKGSEELAEVQQGLIRHIEHISNAKLAYLWAAGAHGALVPGFGFMKLETAYVGKGTFDQDIFIRPVKDPFKILPDFTAQLPDMSDAQYWFEFESMTKDEYQSKYYKSKLTQPVFTDWAGISKAIGLAWISYEQITVAKYWYKDVTIRHFALFSDGTTGYLDEYGLSINDKGETEVVDEALRNEKAPRIAGDDAQVRTAIADSFADQGPPDQYPVTESMMQPEAFADVERFREEVEERVYWVVTNGVEILDRGEWNDSEFPFVAVVGRDEIVDGHRDMHGIIRHAKDTQKMANYMASQVVRRVDIANKSQWIAADEAIPDNLRKYWENANIEDFSVLYYKSKGSDQQPLPIPTRGDSMEPAIQGMMAAQNQFLNATKSTVGIYEAGIGQAMGDRQSGDAIQTLAQRGEINNFHFSDNLVMSIKRLGFLTVRLIPKIYDTARTVRIVGLDDESELVQINQPFVQNGKNMFHDVAGAAGYDVVIDTGPSFASKKSEQMDVLIRFAAANPQLAPAIADLIAGNLDVDASKLLVQRIQAWQAITMPQLHAEDGTPDLPPQAKVAFQQTQQQLAQANQHVATLSQAYQAEKYKNDTQAVAHASKERIEQIKGFYTLQAKRLDIVAEAVQSRNKLALEAAKVQLNHINAKQSMHLKALQAIDQASGAQDQGLYSQLQSDMSGPGATLDSGGQPALPAPQQSQPQAEPPQQFQPGQPT